MSTSYADEEDDTLPPQRETYTAASIHHQTLLGKALYEHATTTSFIAAVATSSSSLRNSSLGPNLLALTPLKGSKCGPLFEQFFFSSSTSSTLQFTRKIFICDGFDPSLLISNLINKTPYFKKSLKELTISIGKKSYASSFTCFGTTTTPQDTNNNKQQMIELNFLHLVNTGPFIGDELLVHIQNTFSHHHLTELRLQSNYRLTEGALLENIIDKYPQMTKLDLACSNQCVTDQALTDIARKMPQLIDLNIVACGQVTEVGLGEVMLRLKNLSRLECHSLYKVDLNKIDLDDDGASESPSLTSLKNLSLANWGKFGSEEVTTRTLNHLSSNILQHCHHLSELILSYNRDGITAASLRGFISGCISSSSSNSRNASSLLKSLSTLSLENCRQVGDDAVHLVVDAMPNLTNLSLNSCDGVTDVGVAEVISKLVGLTELDVSSCSRVRGTCFNTNTTAETSSSSNTRILNLKTLRLMSCHQLSNEGLQNIITNNRNKSCSYTNLTFIDVNNCVELRCSGFENINLPNLKTLNIGRIGTGCCSGIRGNDDTAMKYIGIALHKTKTLNSLTELDLTYWDGMTDKGLEYLVSGGDDHHGVYVCEDEDDLSGGSSLSNLKQLNLNNCTKITDFGLRGLFSAANAIEQQEATSSTNHLARLETLTLNQCPKITGFAFKDVKLPSLSFLVFRQKRYTSLKRLLADASVFN